LLTGIRGETVTAVAQRLLAHHGGLRGLFRLDVAELARIRTELLPMRLPLPFSVGITGRAQ
jgi:hypothetical protein